MNVLIINSYIAINIFSVLFLGTTGLKIIIIILIIYWLCCIIMSIFNYLLQYN